MSTRNLNAGQLARLLSKRAEVTEYIVRGTDSAVAMREIGDPSRLTTRHSRTLEATIYRDVRNGRGESQVAIVGLDDRTVSAAIDSAIEQAASAVGPAWQLPAPAAPSSVALLDDAMARGPDRAADEAAARLIGALPSDLRITQAQIAVTVETTEVRTSGGYANRYRAGALEWNASLTRTSDGKATTREGAVRRLSDLDFAEIFAGVQPELDRADAPRPEPGLYDLLLRIDALIPANGPPLGFLQPIAEQCDGALVRRGLSRFRPGQRITVDEPLFDRLTLISDATRPFGHRSAPFGPSGEPSRRHPLISGGIADGLVLGARDAALQGTTPTGVLGDLEVATGAASTAELSAARDRPLLDMRTLTWLKTEPWGQFVAELGVGDRVDKSGSTPVRGGLFAGDLFELLGRVQLSREADQRGWYSGPAAIRLDRVTIT